MIRHVFFTWFLVGLGASSLWGQTFRAGAATSNITPPLGNDIVGGFVPSPSTHIHDELYARCLVLDDGKTKLVFVVCDLLGVHQQVSEDARSLIEKDLGVPPSHVLICGTHTHSASSVLGKDSRMITHVMDEYQRFVSRRIVDGVKRALNHLRPAEIAWGSIQAPEHVFNRRWFLKEGTMPANPFGTFDKVKTNPGSGPHLVKPAGPTDPELPFFAVREPGGKPIALFSTYSLHYVGGVGDGHISADYFGVYANRIAELLQADRQTPPFVAMMANGTSGDINNNDLLGKRPRRKPYEQMNLIADDLAQKVVAALGKLSYRADVTLDARYREPPIGTRRPSPEMLEWAKTTLADPEKVAIKRNLPAIYARRVTTVAQNPAQIKMPLQAFRIGDVALATMPCEVFCDIGLEYKAKSPIKKTWLVSLAHGYYGYLPSPAQHELGGYETWLGTNRLERTASDRMLAELLAMTAELAAKK